ncbi:MAG TPA: MarR family winged helix-turn-helix transcriptional regulator [Planctomycetaceae bacterium]|nr:MarR family winged helix-turn-helix transcriptional regulator [Planctomycetaceae bacterium]
MHRGLSVEDRIARALRQIARAIDLHSRALLQEHGLTVPQLATLLEIERLQPVSTGSLAAEIHLGSATLTGILDRLEERGLVCRTRHAGDRRSVLISLTDLGTELFASAPSQLCDAFSRRLSQLPEWEQTSILSTLQRVAGMMEPCAGALEAEAPAVPGRFASPSSLMAVEPDPAYDQSNPSVPNP